MDVAAKISELKNDIAARRAQAMESPEHFAPVDSEIAQHNWDESEFPEGTTDTNELLQEIMRIYTLADNLTQKIESSDASSSQMYMDIANPYIETVMNLAEVISQYFVAASKNSWVVTPELKEFVEAEFRGFFEVMRTTIIRLEERFAPKGDIEEYQEEYIKPSSPMAEKYLKMVSKTKRGTNGARIARVVALAKDKNTKSFVFSIEEFGYHIAQILLEFEWLGIASYRKAYPTPGYASEIVRKNMGVK